MHTTIAHGIRLEKSSKQPRFISFKGRLVILLMVMILPFIGFSIYKALDINKSLENEHKAENLILARNIAQDIDEYINATGELLIPIAKNENVRKQNFPAVKALFKELLPNYPFYKNIIFIDSNGDLRVAAANEKKSKKKVNVRDTVHYKRAMQSTGISVGDFMYSKLSGEPVVHVTYPVFDYSGKRIGYVAAAFDLTKIQHKLMEVGLGSHMLVTVLDNKGIIVARSKEPEKWVGKNLSTLSAYTAIRGHNSGSGKATSVDGAARIYGFSTTSKVPWYVWVGVDTAYIQTNVSKQLVIHFAVFLPLLLIALFGWSWIGRDVDRLHKETEYLTLVDPLTGLWNQRKLEQDFVQELNRARRYKEELSFAMIDIDHFKHYNDNNGHQMGDEALRITAEVICNAVREADIVYRYGGEELCVLLPTTDKRGAAHVVERIRSDMEKAIFTGEENQPLGKLTLSIGVATYPDDSISREGLIKSADIALYKAKEKGRNRVKIYGNESAISESEKPTHRAHG